VCRLVADQVVDAKTNSRYASTHVPDALADFVHTVMALTTEDPRAAQAQAILQSHYAAAAQSGSTPTDALKSTFVLACLSPSSVALGM
jgi:hypothetical protein